LKSQETLHKYAKLFYNCNVVRKLFLFQAIGHTVIPLTLKEQRMDNVSASSPEELSKVPKKRPISGFTVFVAALIVGIVLNVFFVNSYVVPSTSMTNTLQVGDYMMSAPLLDNAHAPQRGTIIVFNPPKSWGEPDGTVFVKRVIAVGGDHISCCSVDGKVQINGKSIDEPYLKDGVNNTQKTFDYVVPKGELFVMGDNRLNSADSRYHPTDPFVPVNRVLGQPHIRFWPLNRLTWLQ
jgi:signal peptidase I